ncbi:unnamed protein product [Aphanomyces euteiches]
MSGRPPNRSRSRSPQRRGYAPSRSPPRRQDDRGGGYDDQRGYGGGGGGRGYGGGGGDRGYGGRDDRGGYDRDDRGGGGYGRGGGGGGYGGRDDRGGGGGYGGRDDRGGGGGYGGRDDRGGGGGRFGGGGGGGRFGGGRDGGRGFGGRGGGGNFSIPSGPPPEPVKSQLLAPQVDTLFPCRPAFGSHGQPIVVWANYYQVDLKPGQGDIYHYDVVFCPHGATPTQSLPVKELCLKVLGLLIAKLKEEFPTSTVVSDGRRNIYTPTQLPFDNRVYVISEVFESGKSKEWDVHVKAADPVAIPMSQVEQFFSGQLNFTPYEAIMALDIALRASANIRFTAVGRNFFSPANKASLGEGAELWYGYHQSLRPTQTRLALNIDVAATAFIEQMSLPDYIQKVMGDRINWSDPGFIKQAARILKSVKVRVTHRPIKKEFKITGLSSSAAKDTFFTKEDGSQMSISEYFALTYQALRHPEWPCAQIGKKSKPQFLPLEVCETIGGQKVTRKETPNQVANIIKYTCTKPEERRRKIEDQIANAHFEADNCLEAFGATINPKMLAVQARQLPDPELVYARNSIERPRDGTWNLRSKGFFEGKELLSFAILNLGNPRDDRPIEDFFRALVQQLDAVNMQGPRGPRPPLLTRNRQSVEELFQEAIYAAEQTFGSRPRVIFAVNGVGDSVAYMDLKRASDVTFGIPSQCMLAKHIQKKSPQYIANLLLKVNMKLGGRNSICRADLPKVSECPTIIFGCDVTHPGPGNKSQPSIASCVATMDKYASHHAACVRKQGSRVEYIEDLESMVNELLKRFYQSTHVKPERILIYRDGLSDGQFHNVLTKEVAAIRAACEKLDPDYKPPITYVVVQKRHHTRIFPTQAHECDRSGNCKAGTVVDTGICHPTEYDFFLMSHSGLQGTSRPGHYHVLLDEINFHPDELQTLTYHLCYTFARCTRAVGVVPTIYYAHLVAERARLFVVDSSDGGSTVDGTFVESTGRLMEVHRDLLNVMYYL